MALKKSVVEPAKKSNKFRLVVFEGDMSDGSVSEIAHALSAALRPSTSPVVRQVHNGKPAAQLIAPEAEGEEQVEEQEEIVGSESDEEIEETPAEAPKVLKAPRAKKSKPPTYLHDLIADADAAKAFATERAPASRAKQYLTAMFWLKEVNSTPTSNIDKIYTFYKTVGWSVGFNDWNQAFHKLTFDDLIRKADVKGDYAINPTGEAVVKSLPE